MVRHVCVFETRTRGSHCSLTPDFALSGTIQGFPNKMLETRHNPALLLERCICGSRQALRKVQAGLLKSGEDISLQYVSHDSDTDQALIPSNLDPTAIE